MLYLGGFYSICMRMIVKADMKSELYSPEKPITCQLPYNGYLNVTPFLTSSIPTM